MPCCNIAATGANEAPSVLEHELPSWRQSSRNPDLRTSWGALPAFGEPDILRTIAHVTSIFGLGLAFAMLLPALTDLADQNDDFRVFVGTGFLVGVVCALVAVATRGERPQFTQKLGFLLVTTVWLTACLIGSLPIYFSSVNVSFAGAIFESMSGLTTTGSTVISGLDSLPRGILLWRSLLQWLGGIGIIATFVSLLVVVLLSSAGVRITTVGAWFLAPLVVWIVSAVVTGVLTALLIDRPARASVTAKR